MYAKPKFSGLHEFHKLLNYNATNVPIKLTNGNYGLLPLIISSTNCENLYCREWIIPNDFGSLLS